MTDENGENLMKQPEEPFSDEEIRYQNIVSLKKMKQVQVTELLEKIAEVSSMIEVVDTGLGEIPLKLKIFEDMRHKFIDEHDSFLGDNPEVLIGEDITKYEYIQDMIKTLDKLFVGGRLETETLEELRDKYIQEQTQIIADINRIGKEMDKLMRQISAQDSDRMPPTKRRKKKIMRDVNKMSLSRLIGTLSVLVAFWIFVTNPAAFKFLLSEDPLFSPDFKYVFFSMFLLLNGLLIYSGFFSGPRGRRGRRRRYYQ